MLVIIEALYKLFMRFIWVIVCLLILCLFFDLCLLIVIVCILFYFLFKLTFGDK